MRVAICYWGMTRSTRLIYETHYEKLFKPLKDAGILYDVYIHTWHVEQGNIIWGNISHIPIEYEEYQLLEPTKYRIDSQDEFLETLDFSDYYYQHEKDSEWSPDLLRNYLCGLESQKRVTNMCLESSTTYDAIIYIRPDVMLVTAFSIEWLYGLDYNTIRIPDSFHYGGYNDRCAIVHPKSCKLYSHRIDTAKEYRRNVKCIVSEIYMKYILDTNFSNIEQIRFNMLLVRPSGATIEWTVFETDPEVMAQLFKSSHLEKRDHSVN